MKPLPTCILRPDELIVDLFAGGGGASEGIFEALGRHPDIAINHDEDAVAVHTRNHPTTHHFCQSIWKVHPLEACGDRPVGLLWASPDCRHFSRAAGGRPKWKSVRSLPGVVLTWAKHVRPRVIVVENVQELEFWGPLLDDGTPDPKRIGLSFKIWAGRLRGLGYKVEWRNLCAADFGVPTIRTRLFIVARLEGKPQWPQPTHHKEPSLFEQRWRPAAECIDWSLPCPSIFNRVRPLADATLRRIAEGVQRYVIGAQEPFIVRIGHWSHRSGEGFGFRGQGIHQPMSTCTTIKDKALVVPHVSAFYGTSIGAPADAPLGTVTAQSNHHALISALIAQHNGGVIGRDARDPLSTLTAAASQQQVVQATLSPEDEEGARRVAAFLIAYYGAEKGQHQDLREPLGTATTKARFALVTVDGVPLPIVDIGMRMLTVDECKAAQGFRPGYDMSDGGRITKTKQMRLIGNSVCPGAAAAVLRANVTPARAPQEMAA